MELSRFSKQFKMLGGGALLVLAYAPMFLGSFGEKGDLVESKGRFLSNCESVFGRAPVFQAKLTDSLNSGYFGEIDPICFNVADSGTPCVESVADVKRPAEPLRFIEIKSGPYKGGKLIKGTIHNNFYVDAKRLSVPVRVIDKVIKSLSSKIDFRRSLKKGDQFEIAFNDKKELIYSKIKTKRRQASVYKFGKEGYFLDNGTKVGTGKSDGKFAPPIRGKMRVSSPFGVRIHPITRVRKKHNGVDLAAGHGTPIYAIYDGVVTRASRYSGYGKCVDIKHKNGYASRYGHLSRMVVRLGSKVRKGQLIAYSGATGAATGPHLHLELARNNVNVNPLSVKMMPGKEQHVSNRRQFNSLKNYFSNLSNSVK